MNKNICKKCINKFNKLDICDECLVLIADDIAEDVARGVWNGLRWYFYGGAVVIFLLGMLIGYSI